MAIETQLNTPTILASSRSNKDELIDAILDVSILLYIFQSEKIPLIKEFTVISKISIHRDGMH